MNSSDDVQTELLRNIWNEMKGLNGRIDKTNERIDRTNEELVGVRSGLDNTSARVERVEQGLEGLGRQLVASEVRTATAINALAGTLGDIRELLSDRLDLRDRMARCERDIEELKARGAPAP